MDYKDKKNLRIAVEFYKKNKRYPLLCPPWFCNIPNEVYKDFDHYTDEYVEKHYNDCMENFDLNMKYFEGLDHNYFNEYLMRFVKKNKFIETDDLNVLNNKIGVYILVLDKYNQVYIGISELTGGIKKRILQHWSTKKEFGRLLCGDVNTSILSLEH